MILTDKGGGVKMNCCWSVPDKIIIIESTQNRLYISDELSIPKAYVVFGDNKKALENARNWAGRDSIEHNISNDIGFTFEIIECAGNSSQGGKLSFWNCRMKNAKENIDVSVGINSQILCLLLQETTFINGFCQGNVIFAKYNGQLGVVCIGTKSYDEAIQSQTNKNNLKTGKTVKWEKGFAYRTQNTSDVWIGDAYKPITVESDYFTKITYDLRYIGKKFHVIMQTSFVDCSNLSIWTWRYNTKFVKSFPSRQKDDAVYFSEDQLDKLISDNIKIGVKKALSENVDTGDICDCLVSTDGEITDDMMSNFKQSFSKLLERYSEFYRRKHIVICADGEHGFSNPDEAYNFMEQKLNEFRARQVINLLFQGITNIKTD